MESTPSAIELAKLHETEMVGAKIKLDSERRAVEALLIGKTAVNRNNRTLEPLTISVIHLTAHGTVQVWGKKKRHSVKSFLIGGLGAVELLNNEFDKNLNPPASDHNGEPDASDLKAASRHR